MITQLKLHNYFRMDDISWTLASGSLLEWPQSHLQASKNVFKKRKKY
jgi:hypothetical protein